MKGSIAIGKCLFTVAAVVLGMLNCTIASAQSQAKKLRVGVYDSRAVAVAYANSTEFKEAMKPIESDYKKAKEDRDEKRMKEIDSRMKLQQRRAHELAFSTGSVAPILAKVKSSLPDVAKQAGVQLIVSKWELNHHASEVEVVDVTDKIVALFHVSEKGLKWSKEVQRKPLMSIEQITEHRITSP